MSSIVRASSMEGAPFSQKEGSLPVVDRQLMRKMVNRFGKIVVQKAIAEYVSDKQLHAKNFVMGFLDQTGGKLSFVDGSVSIDVPPGALSFRQVVFCCRMEDGDLPTSAATVIFYSTILGVGATEKKFDPKIVLRFRHSAKFDNEEQKKQLAAVVQDKGGIFHIEPDFEIDVDDEFVTLRVSHFCNVGVGADPDHTRLILPRRKLLAMTYLKYAESTKKTSTDLRILVGPDDEAHMEDLRNLVAGEIRRRNTLSDGRKLKTALWDRTFKPIVCSPTSGLRFRYIPNHYTPDPSECVIDACQMGPNIREGSTLGRENAGAFDPEAALCNVIIQEDRDERCQRTVFDIRWDDREDNATVLQRTQPPCPEAQGAHAGDQGGLPDELNDFTNRYYLGMISLSPSEQP